jgi:hypothetical protein
LDEVNRFKPKTTAQPTDRPPVVAFLQTFEDVE